jgi:hypothetical protein
MDGYGGQPGYGGVPGYPGGAGYGLPQGGPPPNYLAWAIVTTILCCLPAGIISIVYAAQVNRKWLGGDVNGAWASSRNARTWAIIAAVAGPVIAILWAIFVTADTHHWLVRTSRGACSPALSRPRTALPHRLLRSLDAGYPASKLRDHGKRGSAPACSAGSSIAVAGPVAVALAGRAALDKQDRAGCQGTNPSRREISSTVVCRHRAKSLTIAERQ